MNPKGPASLETIITASLVLTVLALATGAFNFYKNHENVFKVINREKPALEENIPAEKQPPAPAAQIDSSDWKTYRNQKYDFEIKYPKDWTVSPEQFSSNTESKIYFEKSTVIKKTYPTVNPKDYSNLNYGLNVTYPKNLIKPFGKTPDLETETKGFYILIRNVTQSLGPNVIDSSVFPPPTRSSNYEKIYSIPLEANVCYFREIQILKDNFYFQRNYFYATLDNKHTFNLVPFRKKSDTYYFYSSKNEANRSIPEFNPSVSTFKFWQKVIAPPAVKKIAPPTINVRKPVSAIRVGGRLVCAKKNDHPAKSKKGKGKHLDLECCLDPDEYPNPWCSYK